MCIKSVQGIAPKLRALTTVLGYKCRFRPASDHARFSTLSRHRNTPAYGRLLTKVYRVYAAVTNCATEATGYSGRAGLKVYRIF